MKRLSARHIGFWQRRDWERANKRDERGGNGGAFAKSPPLLSPLRRDSTEDRQLRRLYLEQCYFYLFFIYYYYFIIIIIIIIFFFGWGGEGGGGRCCVTFGVTLLFF